MRIRSASCALAALPLFAAACSSSGHDAPSTEDVAAGSSALSTSAVPAASSAPSAAEFARIQAFRESFFADSEVRHSFHNAAGDAVECIDFEAQGSVKALRAQGLPTIADHLPPAPAPPADTPAPNGALPGVMTGDRDDAGRERRCPAGTVPALRPTVAQIMARGGLDGYRNAKKHARPPQQSPFQYDCWLTSSGGPQWDHAAGVQRLTYSGALTYTSLYRPYIYDVNHEHTLSQMWVETGNCEYWDQYGPSNPCTIGGSGNAVQSVEVGWMVGNAAADGNPHLFVFSTQDGYYQKSCFAGEGGNCCPAPGSGQGTDCWVAAPGAPYVVNQSLGSSFPTGVTPTEMAIQVWNGAPYGYPAWFVWINGQLIGWYPSTTFWGQMQTSASYLQVGGEVYDSWPNGAHTPTAMGSGVDATAGYEHAAYHRSIMTIDSAKAYHPASLGFLWVPPEDQEANKPGLCGFQAGLHYSLTWSPPAGAAGWGSYFYFGGH
jgi:hypothetical protein